MMIIDADSAILGRLASNVAKRLLEGETIEIINAEMAVVTGSKKHILSNYKELADRGHRYKGPFFPKVPHLILKRTIRGMLPWKKPKGREAFKRLKVHIGSPEELKAKEIHKISRVSIERSNSPRFIRLGDISKFLGWTP